MQTPAQHLFNIMSAHGINLDSLALMSQLVQSGSISLQDEIATDLGPTPISRAMLRLVEPGSFAPQFYDVKAARLLLDMDPGFFMQGKDGPGSTPWLEYSLSGWSRHEDRARLGFADYDQPRVDAWACEVFASLPPNQKTSVSLWLPVLKLGLSQAADVLAKENPGLWAKPAENGKPLIAKANGAWAWEQALLSGVDPYAPTPKGLPFWRAALPQASSSEADPGSFRDGVECWVLNQLKKTPDNYEFLEYFRRTSLARMSVNIGKTAWRGLSRTEQLAYVSQLPDRWVIWSRDSIPNWIRMEGQKNDGNKLWFIKGLEKNKDWRTHIENDPLSHLAFMLLRTHPDWPKLPPAFNLTAALEDPRQEDTLEYCRHLLNANEKDWQARIDALILQVQTPQAQHAKSEMRL